MRGSRLPVSRRKPQHRRGGSKDPDPEQNRTASCIRSPGSSFHPRLRHGLQGARTTWRSRARQRAPAFQRRPRPHHGLHDHNSTDDAPKNVTKPRTTTRPHSTTPAAAPWIPTPRLHSHYLDTLASVCPGEATAIPAITLVVKTPRSATKRSHRDFANSLNSAALHPRRCGIVSPQTDLIPNDSGNRPPDAHYPSIKQRLR